MIEISRSPLIAICMVRGIGVAVSVSTSTCERSSLSRSLWVTPNRCSSSMTHRPRFFQRTSLDSSRWVPITTSSVALGQSRHRALLVLGTAEAGERSDPHRESRNRSEKVTKCCSASTVVGASTATWWPPSTASKVARSATSVLP